jgi:hypothetical protein
MVQKHHSPKIPSESDTRFDRFSEFHRRIQENGAHWETMSDYLHDGGAFFLHYCRRKDIDLLLQKKASGSATN